MASVLLERLLDMLTILVLLGLVMCLVPGVEHHSAKRHRVLGPRGDRRRDGGGTATQAPARALGLVRWVLARMPAKVRDRADAALHSFIEGLQGIGEGAVLLRIVGYSIFVWTVIGSAFGLGLLACDLEVPFVTGALALVTIVAGAVSAPSAPGFIGTFQAGCVVALGLFGISRADAIPYAFVVWGAQWLTQIVLGVVFLLRENISFGDVRAAEEPTP